MTVEPTPPESAADGVGSGSNSAQASGHTDPLCRFSAEAVELFRVWFGAALIEDDHTEALRRYLSRRAQLAEVQELARLYTEYRMLRLRESGATVADIAAVVGCKSSWVETILARVRKLVAGQKANREGNKR